VLVMDLLDMLSGIVGGEDQLTDYKGGFPSACLHPRSLQ